MNQTQTELLRLSVMLGGTADLNPAAAEKIREAARFLREEVVQRIERLKIEVAFAVSSQGR